MSGKNAKRAAAGISTRYVWQGVQMRIVSRSALGYPRWASFINLERANDAYGCTEPLRFKSETAVPEARRRREGKRGWGAAGGDKTAILK
jgi:hypothetical protein